MPKFRIVYLYNGREFSEYMDAWHYKIEDHGVLTLVDDRYNPLRSYRNWIKVEKV